MGTTTQATQATQGGGPVTLKGWNAFLTSLATRGGAILVLLLLSLVGFAITLHIIHHGEEGSMVAAGLVTTVGNFTGALLLALKGSSETTSSATVSPDGSATVKMSDSAAAATAATSAQVPPVAPEGKP